MTRIAVTGASGFIGRHALGAFQDAGLDVQGLTRSSTRADLRSVNYLDADAAARALEGAEVVVHIAGLAHIGSKALADPLEAFRAGNTRAAEQLARASVRAGARKFILLSSAGLLGRQSPPGGFNDASPAMPYDAYTVSKFEAEQRVQDVAGGRLSIAILRPPMVYGPGAPGSFGRLCGWINRGLPLPLGRIEARRSFVGVRNLCSLLLTIATQDKQAQNACMTMLVDDGDPLSVAEFAQRIAGAQQRRAMLLPVPASLLKWTLGAAGLGDEYRRLALPFELFPSRAQELFAWRPPYTPAEELIWTLKR